MQWDISKNSGFSDVKPWIRVNENYAEGINVAQQEPEKDSVLNYFRGMVEIRKKHLGLVYGNYELLLPENEEVYTYLRTFNEERYLVLLSFSTKKVEVLFEELNFDSAKLLISNDDAPYVKKDSDFVLEPYQACVYQLY